MTDSAAPRVRALHRKPETPGEHGLPKPEVPVARVTRRGMEGDFNRWRHETQSDNADMALLVLPMETIADLNREGWPIRPGDLGENITTEGIPYGELRPGRRFSVGSAEFEVTKACTPCDNLLLLPYVGAAKGKQFLATMIDRRGWYARVVRDGEIRTGDALRPV